MLWLKPPTAFPNHKRMIKNEEMPRGIASFRGFRERYFGDVPIMKPNIPIQAETCCTISLSSAKLSLGPSLARKVIMLERTKNVAGDIRETPISAGVLARISVQRPPGGSCKAQPSVDHPSLFVRCGNYVPCIGEERARAKSQLTIAAAAKRVVASSVRWGFLELEGSMLNADASVKLTYPLKHSTPRNLAGTGEHHEKHVSRHTPIDVLKDHPIEFRLA